MGCMLPLNCAKMYTKEGTKMNKGSEKKLPLYRQIENYIVECIHDSRYPQGMLIPSEEEFCRMFQTSRMTVRKATNNLISRGMLHSIKGKGTFVSKFNFEKTMNSVTGWRDTMLAAGYRTKTKVLRLEKDICDEKIAKYLNIPVGAEIYILERLRYADDIPVLIEKAHLNVSLFPNFMDIDFSQKSLYETMEKEYGITLHHVYQKLKTQTVSGKHAQMIFDVEEAVALVMENTSYDIYTRPVEYTISHINGERYSLRYVVNKH